VDWGVIVKASKQALWVSIYQDALKYTHIHMEAVSQTQGHDFGEQMVSFF
jgi:hypothetical protein